MLNCVTASAAAPYIEASIQRNQCPSDNQSRAARQYRFPEWRFQANPGIAPRFEFYILGQQYGRPGRFAGLQISVGLGRLGQWIGLLDLDFYRPAFHDLEQVPGMGQ